MLKKIIIAIVLFTLSFQTVNAKPATKSKQKSKIQLKQGMKVFNNTKKVSCGVVYSMQPDNNSGKYVFTVIGQPASRYQNNLYNPCNAKVGDKFVLLENKEFGTIGTVFQEGAFWFGQPTAYIEINNSKVYPGNIEANPNMLQN